MLDHTEYAAILWMERWTS